MRRPARSAPRRAAGRCASIECTSIRSGEPRLVARPAASAWSAAHSPACRRRSSAGPARRDACRARCTARCSATMVLPVPAEPETRAGPAVVALDPAAAAPGAGRPSTSPTGSRAPAPAPRRWSCTRKRRCASGCSKGSASGAATLRRPAGCAAGRQLEQRLGGLRRAGGRPGPAACPRRRRARRRATRRARRSRAVRRPAASAKSSGFGEVATAAAARRLHVDRDHDLLDRLADLDELRGAGLRMRLELAPLGPGVGLVVVVDVAEQQAARRSCGR